MKEYNFSAGPAMLPEEVLRIAQQELLHWQDNPFSVMEISHRSHDFISIAQIAERDFRQLLTIPDNYHVLFCQGGARAQFAAIPLNLLYRAQSVDYVNSGYWSYAAFEEAEKYCSPHCFDAKQYLENKRALIPYHDWHINKHSGYVHYCANETIDGLAFNEEPEELTEYTLIADFSSTILSRPIDISRYGVIYAGAQKNIGPAGITVVIIRKDLVGRSQSIIPSVFDYQLLAEHGSMFNTPPTFAWYFAGLVFKWLLAQGGLAIMAEKNQAKASYLYHFIDTSDFYYNDVFSANRSWMNVTFKLVDEKLNDAFILAARQVGLYELKGHRIVGGMRASLYNAMPFDGVKRLVQFMQEFERSYG